MQQEVVDLASSDDDTHSHASFSSDNHQQSPPRARRRRNRNDNDNDVISLIHSPERHRQQSLNNSNSLSSRWYNPSDNINNNSSSSNSNEWACSRCTLLNHQENIRCSACDTIRSNSISLDDDDNDDDDEVIYNGTTRPPQHTHNVYNPYNDTQISPHHSLYNPTTPTITSHYVGSGVLLGGMLGAADGYANGTGVARGVVRGAMSGAVGGVLVGEMMRPGVLNGGVASGAGAGASDSAAAAGAAYRTGASDSAAAAGAAYRTGGSTTDHYSAPIASMNHGVQNNSDHWSARPSFNTTNQNQHHQQQHSSFPHPNRTYIRQNPTIFDHLLQSMTRNNNSHNHHHQYYQQQYHHNHHQHYQPNIDNMSYEHLLHLFGDGTENLNRTLPPSIISTLPHTILTPTSIQSIPEHLRQCVICMEEYGVGEERMVLPCCHGFHRGCLVKWLGEQRGCCPVCMMEVGG